MEYRYLVKGLLGMSRAHRANGMAGHLGAAVLARYFIDEDFGERFEGVSDRLSTEAQRVMDGDEALWFDEGKAGVSIAELFAGELTSGDSIPPTCIANALEKSMSQLRASGHNVIFASLALRALTDHPELATQSIVSGIEKLIAGFASSGMGRGYFGKESGWRPGERILATVGPSPGFRYASAVDMVHAVLGAFAEKGGIRQRGFGGFFHLLNHTAALLELERLGYDDLFHQGQYAHQQHLVLLRALPDLSAELGALARVDALPNDPGYWPRKESIQWSGWLTHRLKTLYGFYTVLEEVEDPVKKDRAEDQFRYLMA